MFEFEVFFEVYVIFSLKTPTQEVFRVIRWPGLKVDSLKCVVAFTLNCSTTWYNILWVVILHGVEVEGPKTLVIILFFVQSELRLKLSTQIVPVYWLCIARLPSFVKASDLPFVVIVDHNLFVVLCLQKVQLWAINSLDYFALFRNHFISIVKNQRPLFFIEVEKHSGLIINRIII